MLELNLRPKFGNAGGRFFPHTGYLGVTHVSVQGTVVAKLPELCQPLPVKAIFVTIRCVETRSAGVFGVDGENVLWEKSKRLWEPAGEGEYEELGDWDSPFSISVPADVMQRSQACSSQWLKEWKVVWKLEVAIEHRPIPYVGHRISKTYALDLVNYRSPALPPLSPPSPITVPGAQVQISPPHGSYGPDDTFAVTLHVKPDDPSVQLKKAIVVLERTIDFLDARRGDDEGRDAGPESARSSTGRPSTAPAASTNPSPSRFSSLFRRSVSPRPPLNRSCQETPSPELESCPISTEYRSVIEAVCDEPVLNSGGLYTCTIPLSIPKRGGKWDTGETMRTKLINVSFSLRAKVVLKSATSSRRSQAKEYILPPQAIVLSGTSQAERSAAQASVAAAAVLAPKSLTKRRHRSSRRGLYIHEGTVDITDPIVRSLHTSSPTSHRRRRTRSETPEAIPVLGVATASEVKPILLVDDGSQTAPAQSISFAFPSPLPVRSSRMPTPPGDSPDWPRSPTSSLSSHTLPPISSLLQQPGTYESMSILKQFQQTGRRISNTTSEEDEIQPSRTRLRYDPVNAAVIANRQQQLALNSNIAGPSAGPLGGQPDKLPSLSALGFGLPQIPDEERPARRPRTAPVHSTFAMRGQIPPPLSGDLSEAVTAGVVAAAAVEAAQVQRPTTSFARPSTSFGSKGRLGGFGSTPPSAADRSLGGEGSFAFALSPGAPITTIAEVRE